MSSLLIEMIVGSVPNHPNKQMHTDCVMALSPDLKEALIESSYIIE